MARRLVSVREAAELLDVSVSWIYRRTSTGQMPFIKRGYWVLFDPEALRRWARRSRRLISPMRELALRTEVVGTWGVVEVAAHVRRSVSWVYRRTSGNQIPHIKVGNDLRFDPARIRSWASKHDFARYARRG